MKQILLFGAGMSASSLIKYLLEQCDKFDWQLKVIDRDLELINSKLKGHAKSEAIVIDITDDSSRRTEIKKADIVISMLPAFLHVLVAEDCLDIKKNLVTASYVSQELKDMTADVEAAGLCFMNEIGLDPGIDHMSAMKVIHSVKDMGANLYSFKSFTGGLVAPEYDTNPWRYKFTWNPRNVVLAGQGVSQLISDNQYKYIPYHKLFTRTEIIDVLDYGHFEAYANRDSLGYRSIYGIEGIPTILRGTLRRPGYCRAWNLLVQLGMTDDSYSIEYSEDMTYREFTNSFLFYRPQDTVEIKLAYYLGIELNSSEMHKFSWLGLFDDVKIGLKSASPAQILQHLMEQKMSLEPGDKDMCVMQHIFDYDHNGQKKRITSSMVAKGEDQTITAMAKTVGLPLAIYVKLFLNGEIDVKPGVHIPVMPEVYNPVLDELKEYGIEFIEEEINL